MARKQQERLLSRRRILTSLVSLAGSSILVRDRPAWALPPGDEKPNFIFILVDDLGWRDLGCYGSTFYETPNIDSLASQGMRFTNAYAACPVCSPTRASILAGKYPARLRLTDWIPGRKQWPAAKLLTPEFNQQLPLHEVTIAEALKAAGYTSASIGKWHLGDVPFYPDKQGFDLNIAGTRRGSPTSYFGPFDLPGLHGGSSDDYLTERLSDAAEKFVEENKDRPFFLYLPEFAVHLPLEARKRIIERYRAKANLNEPQHDPVYAAMVDSVDQAVGRLMRKLDELKIAGRTVLFFFSDNGGLVYEGRRRDNVTSNIPLRAGKGHLYEGGVREPMIVRWPGMVKPGATCDTPVISVDFLPTILEAAGIKDRPQHLDGVSITPLLKRAGKLERDALFWHYPHYSNQGGVPSGAVRKGDFKLIEFYEDGRLELYNLKEDIGEHRNLVRKFPERAAELHELLKRWRASVNAVMPTVNPDYDPSKADQGLTGAEPATPPI
jgi:arylsulfatase A